MWLVFGSDGWIGEEFVVEVGGGEWVAAVEFGLGEDDGGFVAGGGEEVAADELG